MAPSPSPPGSPRPLPLLPLILIALISLVLLTSLSAHRNQYTSDSASRIAAYLPSTSFSLSSPLRDSSHEAFTPSRPPTEDELLLDPLAYRRFLEATTAPVSNLTTHDRAAGFDHIYVLSLPSRTDRRRDMARMAKALGVEIEFIDAADKREPFIKWIAERVAETREERRRVMAEAQDVDPSDIGGLHIGTPWLSPFPSPPLTFSPSHPLPSFPPFPPDPRFREATNWVSHLEHLYARHSGAHLHLRPDDSGVNVTELLWDPLERVQVRQVHEGVISTYWGQTRAMRRMVENGDRTALILEDDVDVEWDLERLWKGVERRLPRGKDGEEEWDVAFLGHCWGGEFQKPQFLHPLLHPSTGPMCLHGYALTSTGASTLLSHMLDPWRAFSTAVDLVVPTLLHLQSADSSPPYPRNAPPLLRSFSITPPLVVQRKDGPSDLQKGNGSKWRGVLRDSTMERVRRDRGEWHEGWEDSVEMVGVDPATRLRCGPV
ncbi:hypothetical protein JCM6882_009706 [Rhodosporidiobolus microsporus]